MPMTTPVILAQSTLGEPWRIHVSLSQKHVSLSQCLIACINVTAGILSAAECNCRVGDDFLSTPLGLACTVKKALCSAPTVPGHELNAFQNPCTYVLMQHEIVHFVNEPWKFGLYSMSMLFCEFRPQTRSVFYNLAFVNDSTFSCRGNVHTSTNGQEAEVCGLFEDNSTAVTWGTRWQQQFSKTGSVLTCDFVSRLDSNSYSMKSPGFFCACNTSQFSSSQGAITSWGPGSPYKQDSLQSGALNGSNSSLGGYGQFPSTHPTGQRLAPYDAGGENASTFSCKRISYIS